MIGDLGEVGDGEAEFGIGSAGEEPRVDGGDGIGGGGGGAEVADGVVDDPGLGIEAVAEPEDGGGAEVVFFRDDLGGKGVGIADGGPALEFEVSVGEEVGGVEVEGGSGAEGEVGGDGVGGAAEFESAIDLEAAEAFEGGGVHEEAARGAEGPGGFEVEGAAVADDDGAVEGIGEGVAVEGEVALVGEQIAGGEQPDQAG